MAAIEISDSEESPVTRSVAPGDEVVIRLAENPTSGYRWEVMHSGAGELEMVENRFVAAGGTAPGAGGHRLLRLLGRRPGQNQVEVLLRREWDPPGASVQSRVFAFIVR